jgi:oxygen-independent coproporphyrinogen-3 oxidase
MFDLIEDRLKTAGLNRYEISNFAKPGHESKHNMLYWKDDPYWGLGLSAHSYFPKRSVMTSDPMPFGMRLWNTRAMKKYVDSLEAAEVGASFDFAVDIASEQKEVLQKHQALTDYLHTSLRILDGLDENALRLKFGEIKDIAERFEALKTRELVERTDRGWRLSREGRLLANVVFEKLTYLAEDFSHEKS